LKNNIDLLPAAIFNNHTTLNCSVKTSNKAKDNIKIVAVNWEIKTLILPYGKI
jgi:hypothetical protein